MFYTRRICTCVLLFVTFFGSAVRRTPVVYVRTVPVGEAPGVAMRKIQSSHFSLGSTPSPRGVVIGVRSPDGRGQENRRTIPSLFLEQLRISATMSINDWLFFASPPLRCPPSRSVLAEISLSSHFESPGYLRI